ncbi:MAG: hypothetical protein OXF43_01950 [Gammaproteobacteria bacterium]|nr:hypothetical protein [Gammaproteobacteria bacterium]
MSTNPVGICAAAGAGMPKQNKTNKNSVRNIVDRIPWRSGHFAFTMRHWKLARRGHQGIYRQIGAGFEARRKQEQTR